MPIITLPNGVVIHLADESPDDRYKRLAGMVMGEQPKTKSLGQQVRKSPGEVRQGVDMYRYRNRNKGGM